MTPPRPPPIVVIGGSAGALRPLQRILSELPANLPAMVCVVIHMPDDSPSALARLLARAGPLDAEFADDHLPLRPGRVAVAPPGNHLLVHDGTLALSQGARENGVRPAIDPLFRSAARAAGPNVVSVLLSGTLDDGAAGTAIVRAGGGVTIVQDPAEADFPDMPRNAIHTGEVAAVLPVAAIAPAIRAAVETMAHRPAGDGGNNHNDGGQADNPGPEAATAADTPAGDPHGDPVDRGSHGGSGRGRRPAADRLTRAEDTKKPPSVTGASVRRAASPRRRTRGACGCGSGGGACAAPGPRSGGSARA